MQIPPVLPRLRPLSDFERSSVFFFVQRLERDHGTMQIYSRTVIAPETDDEIRAGLLEFMPDLYVSLYGSREAAVEGLLQHVSASTWTDMMYAPAALRWAYAVATPILGNHFDSLRDIFVVPVSIPLFDASATAWTADARAILFHHILVFHLPHFSIQLLRAQAGRYQRNWDFVWQARMDFDRLLQRVYPRVDFAERSYHARWDAFGLEIATLLQCLQTLFILLHEFGHVLCGHLDSHSQVTHFGAHGQAQAQEFEADDFAAKYFLSLSFDELLTIDEQLSEFGVMFKSFSEHKMLVPMAVVQLLIVFHAMELISSEPSSTHPPALDRLGRFLEVVEQSPAYADTLPEIFDTALFLGDFVGWSPEAAG